MAAVAYEDSRDRDSGRLEFAARQSWWAESGGVNWRGGLLGAEGASPPPPSPCLCAPPEALSAVWKVPPALLAPNPGSSPSPTAGLRPPPLQAACVLKRPAPADLSTAVPGPGCPPHRPVAPPRPPVNPLPISSLLRSALGTVYLVCSLLIYPVYFLSPQQGCTLLPGRRFCSCHSTPHIQGLWGRRFCLLW